MSDTGLADYLLAARALVKGGVEASEIKYHLIKIFTTLDVGSPSPLEHVLSREPATAASA
jgi:hypothetical protein